MTVKHKTAPTYDSDTVRREMVKEWHHLTHPELAGQTVRCGTFGSVTVQRSNVLWIRKLAKHMVWPVELGG